MHLRTFLTLLAAGLTPVLSACAADPADAKGTALPTPPAATAKMETATLAAGCFWCTEAVFQRIKGILKVDSGYTGGKIENPTYRQVCEGDTGHAEGVRIEFDPSVISYEKVLRVFFEQHDPTTLNRQGNDVGTQYRSAIFYHSDAQKETAEKVKAELDKSGHYASPVVTEITKAGVFYKAEEYHQNYFTLNKDKNPYCRVVILPKLKKLGIEAKEPETKP